MFTRIVSRRFQLTAMASALALLAACGGGADSPSSAPAEPSAGPAPTPAPAPAPTPPGQGAFSVTLAADKAIVFQGATATVRVTVARTGNFSGAVSLLLGGLPAGVSASPAIVAAGASSAEITLAAEAGAPHSLPVAAKVEGSATIEGTTQRVSQPLTVTVRGTAGMVDTSFASGSFLTRVGTGEDYAQASAVQADGKVLVAGSSGSNSGTHIAVVRYLRDGGLDTSFGDNGRVITPVGGRDDSAKAIAVQGDGKIVVAGVTVGPSGTNYDFVLVRYQPNGAIDTTFGTNGRVVTDFGGDSDRAFALLLMPDGKIVAGGQSNANRTSTGVDFALARYHSDGSLDTGFGQGGKVVAPILPGLAGDIVRGLALQTVNGTPRILAVGGEGDFTAARFTASGTLDSSFGVNGKVTGLFGVSIGSAYAVTVLPTGGAVLAGHVGHDYAAVQLTVDGQLDPRFGPAKDGRFRHAMASANWDEATAVARQVDGKLLLGGWLYTGVGTAGDFGVLRLNADGTFDAGFGSAGTMTHAAAGTKTDLGRAIVLQSDERIPTVRAIVAGEAQDTNRDFALMRLWL